MDLETDADLNWSHLFQDMAVLNTELTLHVL
jgi:hypothetical protein